MSSIDSLKLILRNSLLEPFKKVVRFIMLKKEIPKQQAELEFWLNFYKEVTLQPRIADVFKKISLGRLEERKEFNLSEEQWAELSAKERLLEIGKTMTFPRYRNDLGITVDELAGKRVLDVGCGPMGALSWFEAGFRVGVDELICEYSKLGYPLNEHSVIYVKGVAETLPFADSQFDAVISANALDHVDNFEKAISEIYRVLKPNGKMYLSFNYRENPSTTEPVVLSDTRVKNVLSLYFIFDKVKSESTEFGYSKNCYHGYVRK